MPTNKITTEFSKPPANVMQTWINQEGSLGYNPDINPTVDDKNPANWQLYVSIKPTEDNFNKARLALDAAINRFAQINTVHPPVQLFVSSELNKDLCAWDGTSEMGHAATDHDQRGEEIIISMRYSDGEEESGYELSPYQYKEFMLILWNELDNKSAEYSYITPLAGKKEVPCAAGIISPFAYRSVQKHEYHPVEDGGNSAGPSTQKNKSIRHGNLLIENFNPVKHPDPLDSIIITQEDLVNTRIKHNPVNVSYNRVEYLKRNLSVAVTKLKQDVDVAINGLGMLGEIESMAESSGGSVKGKENDAIGGVQANDPLCKLLKDAIAIKDNKEFIDFYNANSSRIEELIIKWPRRADANFSLIIDIESLNKFFLEYDMGDEEDLKEKADTIRKFFDNSLRLYGIEIAALVKDFENLETLVEDKKLPIAREYFSKVRQIILFSPHEAQKLYRRAINICHEYGALQREQERYALLNKEFQEKEDEEPRQEAEKQENKETKDHNGQRSDVEILAEETSQKTITPDLASLMKPLNEIIKNESCAPVKTALKRLRDDMVRDADKQLQKGKINIDGLAEGNIGKLIRKTEDIHKICRDRDPKTQYSSPDFKIAKIDEYVKETTNSSSRMKKFAEGVGMFAASLMSAVLGSVIGFTAGFVAGAWTGPGAFFTAMLGAITGAKLGWGAGAVGGVAATTGLGGGLAGCLLFRPSKQTKNIRRVADAQRKLISPPKSTLARTFGFN